jgi:methanogenic corrinoid protein MtbC1
MQSSGTDAFVERFLDEATAGHTRKAVELTLDVLRAGVAPEVVIAEHLADAQREIGERWFRNEASIADEHLTTGASESALHALAATLAGEITNGLVVVVSAEGDWHTIAAHMFAEQLRARGVAVAYLGGSTPPDHLREFLSRHQPDALAVSCSLPLYFGGLARTIEVAHVCGIPVLAGGRALMDHPEWAERLGADGWAATIDDATAILTQWRAERPDPEAAHPQLDLAAVALDLDANRLADQAFDDLARRFPAMALYDARQLARTREDLAYIVQFIAAAEMVDDDRVFTTFLHWLHELLLARGVPAQGIIAGLESLQPLLAAVDQRAEQLCAIGIDFVRRGCAP